MFYKFIRMYFYKLIQLYYFNTHMSKLIKQFCVRQAMQFIINFKVFKEIY